MTSEKKPFDLHSIEPIFRRDESETIEPRDDDAVGMAPGMPAPAEDEPPPDPDDLDRLRRG